jgi:aminoglycoside phosphotransferase (APT) family kinase protein
LGGNGGTDKSSPSGSPANACSVVLMKKRRRSQHEDEPMPEGEEWVECGGQRIWAAGFTAAGFPYGLDEHEFRDASERFSGEAGWARAKRILRAVAEQRAGNTAKVEIGYVKKMGHGLSRDVFAAEVDIATSSGRAVDEIAVLLPRRGCDAAIDERTRKEARLLVDLATMDLPFRVPRGFGVCPDIGHPALVRSFERGVELDLRAGRQGRVRPWETVASVAAAIHRVGPESISWLVPRYATRLDHARAAIGELDDLREPEIVDAREWMRDHLPAESQSKLVHGDLLGQNILLGLSEPDAVIDWEYAQFGDPAYDLAIVTRGVRRPFQIEDGMDRLLEAYARAGGVEIERKHVRLHELALAARWYRDALSGENPHGPTQQLQFLRSLLRRASANEHL